MYFQAWKQINGEEILTFKNNYCTFFILTGGTEWQMVASLEDIADRSLLLSKNEPHFQDPEAAKLCILNKISFCEARQKVSFPFFPHFFFCKYPNILLIGALSTCIIIA